MITTRKFFKPIAIFSIAILLIAAIRCSKDEDPAPVPARTTTYNLKVKDVLGVAGTATFTEVNATTTTISLSMTGAPSGSHPAELLMNSAVEGGSVVATLTPVDATGKSSTSVSMTYNELVAYNGHINILKSSAEPDVILLQGDIGGNVITATKIQYVLDTIGSFGVSGNALFERRVNGNTLVTITLDGTINGEEYPSTINLGSIQTVGGGPVVCTLNNIDGTTGIGYTNISKLDSGLNINYDNWLVYDGYINVYQTSVSIGNIISHGNIGSN